MDSAGFEAAGGGANRLLTGILPSGAWLMETILTFTLVIVVFAANDKARALNAAHLPVSPAQSWGDNLGHPYRE